jgi:hypothetical protein
MSYNVFADLDLPKPDELFVRAGLLRAAWKLRPVSWDCTLRVTAKHVQQLDSEPIRPCRAPASAMAAWMRRDQPSRGSTVSTLPMNAWNWTM